MSGNGAGTGMEIIPPHLRRIQKGQVVVLTVCVVVAAGTTTTASVGWLIAAASTLSAVTTIWASASREQSGNLMTFLPYYLLEKVGT